MTDLVRVSDAERESIAKLLAKAHADGRIDTAELEERVARCYAAKTRAELEPLVADLPPARGLGSRSPRSGTNAFVFPPILLLPLLFAGLALAAVWRHPFPLLPILFFIWFRFGMRRRHRYR
jgi:DUF1707 SHOCT-like domain